MNDEFIELYQELMRIDPQNSIIEKYKSIYSSFSKRKENKCKECNGYGYVQIAPGVRGLKKCVMCLI